MSGGGGTSNLIVSLLDLAEMFPCQSQLVMLVCKEMVDLCGQLESNLVQTLAELVGCIV